MRTPGNNRISLWLLSKAEVSMVVLLLLLDYFGKLLPWLFRLSQKSFPNVADSSHLVGIKVQSGQLFPPPIKYQTILEENQPGHFGWCVASNGCHQVCRCGNEKKCYEKNCGSLMLRKWTPDQARSRRAARHPELSVWAALIDTLHTQFRNHLPTNPLKQVWQSWGSPFSALCCLLVNTQWMRMRNNCNTGNIHLDRCGITYAEIEPFPRPDGVRRY